MLEEAKLLEEDFDKVAANRSWASRFILDGVAYATSLFWQPLQNKEDPYLEVGEAAEGILEGADLFCIKPGKSAQFGICVSQEGYKVGENVAAVALATAMSNKSSFVAVFKVEGGWWYTCIRNDIILSDGDMLFLNEEEAKNQFMSMLAVPDWGAKIAPPEWNIEETDYPDLSALLGKGEIAKLQKIKAIRGTKLLIVVAVSAVVGLWLISSIFSAIFTAKPKAPIVAPVAPKSVKKVEPPPPEPKPWEALSEPDKVMVQCYDRILALVNILPPGWKIAPLSCSAGGATTSWKLEVGRITWGLKALDDSGVNFSARSLSDDGKTMMATTPLESIKKVNSPPSMRQKDLRDTLNDLFQALGQDVTLTNHSYTSPQKNTYRSVKFKISSIQNPMVWNDLLTKFSGLEISMIKYNVDTKIWEYEGTIYAL